LERNTTRHFLEGFLRPKSVAVVGASNNPMRINYNLVANLVNLGFSGKIYPVNPGEKEIMGLQSYPSVKDIEGEVDLAVIGVSHTLVPGIANECADRGIRSMTIIAGGFSEAGEDGRKLQSRSLGPMPSAPSMRLNGFASASIR